MTKTEKAAVTVAIVDDHPWIHDGVAAVLSLFGGYKLVLSAFNGKDYIDRCKGRAPAAIVLVDLSMAVMNGYELLAWMREHQPGVRALVFSAFPEDANILRALHLNACGFLDKCSDRHKLKLALDHVRDTGHFHTDREQRLLLENPDGLTPDERYKARVLAQITERKLRVLQLLCTLKKPTNARIARKMRIKRSTVEGHIRDLFVLLEVTGRTELVTAAIRLGLVKI